jgi:hypothetical protein
MKALSVLFLVLATALGALAGIINRCSPIPNMWIPPAAVAGCFVLMALLFRWLAAKEAATRRLLETGLPCVAVILRVSETGVTVNQAPVFRFDLEFRKPGAASWQAQARIRVPRHAVGAITPGKVLHVRVAPADDRTFAVDWEATLAGSRTGPDATQPLPRVSSARELVGYGVPGVATVRGTFEVELPPGTDLRSLKPGDVVLGLVLDVARDDGVPPYSVRVGHWVPAAKTGAVIVGGRLRVAVDRGDPGQVAVDWDNSPVA